MISSEVIIMDVNLHLNSSFPIRTIRDDKEGKDLLIDIGGRVVDLHIEGLPSYILGRFQFTEVSHVIFRYTPGAGTVSSIHFMRSIDMKTSLMTFDLDFQGLALDFVDGEFGASVHIGPLKK